MSKLPVFLYSSRLTREKGFDRIIELVKKVVSGELQAIIHICSGGEMLSELEKLAGSCVILHPSRPITDLTIPQVAYHGYVPGARINELILASDYLLMPSRFLETFGLSALEAVMAGRPIIAQAKWGLFQFTQAGLTVKGRSWEMSEDQRDTCETVDFVDLVRAVASTYTQEKWQKESQAAILIGAKYGQEQWYTQAVSIVGNKAKVLVVTDYSAPLGGIESFTKFVHRTLEDKGHSVSLLTSSTGRTKLLRYIGLAGTAINLPFALRLVWTIYREKPDAIWLQSILRAIGPLGLLPLLWYPWRVVLTYHDLGYFVPHPTRITREGQIGDGSWARFKKDIRSPISSITIGLKYLSLQCMWAIFRRVDIHLIPSEFLRVPVTNLLGNPSARIVLHPHVNPHLWK